MELIDTEDETRMSREDAANLLRRIADSLSRHNSLEINHEGLPITVEVPDSVLVEFEVEVGDDSSIEIEIAW